jgi:anti-sigma regulatory factor (Ser/Thr protein kinase)
VQVTLPPDLTSVPAARHWISAFLKALSDDQRQTAVLLTSELVTNAVLHTATDVTVTARVGREGVRVEVADGSRQAPSLKDYGTEAATGRGLTVLDSLADEWGTTVDELGKVVWFELGPVSALHVGPSPAGTGSPLSSEDAEAAGSDDFVSLSLLEVPVELLVRAQAAYEELFREFRLLVEREPSSPEGIQRRLIDLVDELGTRFAGFTAGADEVWRGATARGDEHVDLHYLLPAEVGPVCRHYDALLDEADQFCRAAALLTLAPAADVVALRKWILQGLADQVDGAAPQAFAQSPWAAEVSGER